MLLAYIVYISLMVVLFLLSWLLFRNKHISNFCKNVLIVFSVIIFSLVIGLRYNVGIDYLNYYNTYDHLSSFDFEFGGYEPGFFLLNILLNKLDLSVCWLFITVALIQISTYYRIFREKIYLLPWAILLLFLEGQVFGMENIMRHFLASIISLVGIEYMSQFKKIWKFFVCVFCAMMFHYSAAVCLLFPLVIFLFRLLRVEHVRILLLSVYVFFILLQRILQGLMVEKAIYFANDVFSLIHDVPTLTGKLSYAFGDFALMEGSGYGRVINSFITIVMIFKSKSLCYFFGKQYIDYFSIYYVGQILVVLAGNDMNLRRIATFYTISSLVVYSYLLSYLYMNWKSVKNEYKIFGVGFLLYYILLFFYKIYVGESGCSPFMFII